MNTSGKEKTAEDGIKSILGQRGLLVAKPSQDERGADLLGFIHICGGAKFCRIQCKYRQAGSKIKIPVHYVPGAFVCIVFLVPKEGSYNDLMEHTLYCFFPNEIRQWHKHSGNYILSLPSYKKCVQRFKDNVLDDGNFKRLCELIQESTIQDEMGILDFSNPNNSGSLALLLDSFDL